MCRLHAGSTRAFNQGLCNGCPFPQGPCARTEGVHAALCLLPIGLPPGKSVHQAWAATCMPGCNTKQPFTGIRCSSSSGKARHAALTLLHAAGASAHDERREGLLHTHTSQAASRGAPAQPSTLPTCTATPCVWHVPHVCRPQSCPALRHALQPGFSRSKQSTRECLQMVCTPGVHTHAPHTKIVFGCSCEAQAGSIRNTHLPCRPSSPLGHRWAAGRGLPGLADPSHPRLAGSAAHTPKSAPPAQP